MDLSTEKQRPQKVEVINNSENPTQVVVSNLPFATSTSLNVQVATGSINVYQIRPNSGRYNVTLDNVLLLQGDGTFVPIPLSTTLTNLTQSNLDTALESYKTAYATLVSGVTSATLHYSILQPNGTCTSAIFDLKSND